MVISCINSKGGVGKSTLAGNLVGWLCRSETSVVLVDCDHQRSSSDWISQAIPSTAIVRLTNADDVLDELPKLAREFEFVVADGPGSQTEINRAIMMWTDLAIIPCKASMFEARALSLNTAFLRQAQAIRQGLPEAIAVLSMVNRNFRLTRDMRQAATSLGFVVASTPLTLRQAYADAPGQQTFVWNMGRSAKDAASEIDALFQSVFQYLASSALRDEINGTECRSTLGNGERERIV